MPAPPLCTEKARGLEGLSTSECLRHLAPLMGSCRGCRGADTREDLRPLAGAPGTGSWSQLSHAWAGPGTTTHQAHLRAAGTHTQVRAHCVLTEHAPRLQSIVCSPTCLFCPLTAPGHRSRGARVQSGGQPGEAGQWLQVTASENANAAPMGLGEPRSPCPVWAGLRRPPGCAGPDHPHPRRPASGARRAGRMHGLGATADGRLWAGLLEKSEEGLGRPAATAHTVSARAGIGGPRPDTGICDCMNAFQLILP